MIVGAIPGDTGYDWLVLVHILLAVVGGGAAFTLAVVGARTGSAAGEARTFGLRLSSAIDGILVSPGLWLAGGTGILLVLVGDPWEFSQTWISVAFTLWIIGVVLATFVARPAGLKAIEAAERGDEESLAGIQKRLSAVGGVLHLTLVLLIVDMVLKPGL